MDEALMQFPDDTWDAGFEGGRYVVVSQLWPFNRISERPPQFQKRLWHSLYELSIRDWTIRLKPLHLGALCVVEAHLQIRYQPTLRYAREHLEFLPDLNRQVESSLQALLQDIAEQEIRQMETESSWLEDGCETIEKAVASIVNEVLVLRGIQCRTLCQIEPHFADVDAVDLNALPPWPRHQAVYQEFLRRRRDAKERLLKEQTEEAANARRLLMEREATLLELTQQEEAQRSTRHQLELESLQRELADAEARLKEQLDSETRKREEEFDHQVQLRHARAVEEWKAREAELEKQRADLATEATRLAEQRENEARLLEERLRHEALIRQRQTEAETLARAAELEKHRAELAAEALRLTEELENATRLQEERLRHETEAHERQVETELKALQTDLSLLRAELEIKATQQTEQQSHLLKQREDELIHEGWLRQMQAEAEIKAKETELESQRLAEETRLAKQLEFEAHQRQEQLKQEARLRQEQLDHEAYLLRLETQAELQAKEVELERLRAEMVKVESQLEQQRECEARQHEEQLRHDAQMRQMQTEQELKEKERRTPEIAELENYLNQEIGMLAMERQRLKLEEEIREAKIARTRDFIGRARRRISLNEDPAEAG